MLKNIKRGSKLLYDFLTLYRKAKTNQKRRYRKII